MTQGSIAQKVTTVNYHLWKACNMRCGFCFATFEDAPALMADKQLPQDDAVRVVDLLCQHGFSKINFAGGEPTLCPWLRDLIRRAKSGGVVTSIVTNGSHITGDWLDSLNGDLDIIALSIDSVDARSLRSIGRVVNGKAPMSRDYYQRIADEVRKRDIRLKINTVVSSANCHENLSDVILSLAPERWKIFQVLPMKGQNDRLISEFVVTPGQFDGYIQRNRSVEAHGIKVVTEDNRLMTGSYIMVDPSGRFFDNTKGEHTYSSEPIHEVGVSKALGDVTIYPERFAQRGGRYD